MTAKVIRATKRAAPNRPAKPDKTLARPIPPEKGRTCNAMTSDEADAIICHAIRTVKAAALLMYKSKGADLLTMKCETAAQDLASLRRYLAQALGV